MEKLIDIISQRVSDVFTAAGYEASYGRCSVSGRPDLCEYQCNGALPAAKVYKKAPIMIAEEICDTKSSLATLTEPVKLYPQFMKNIRVKDKPAVMNDKNVLAALEEVKKLIGKDGRVLLRQSGTEPVIRVMVESLTEEKCVEYAQIVVDKIIEGGHSV